MRQSIVLAAFAAAALAGGAAFAHARLVKANPTAGSTVEREPARLWLRFTESPRLSGTGVRLTAPDGKRTVLGPLAKDAGDDKIVTAPMPPGLGAGRYQVEWRAQSAEGHRTHGQFAFLVKR